MKPFRTHRQQISILRSRGLTINDGSRAMRILERENYYSLINGYKDLFLMKDSKNRALDPEKYNEGSSFDEIYSLYCFDRELRGILLKELLKFECNIKTKIAYFFSKKYTEPNAYLNMINYSRDPNQLKEVLKLISTIYNSISRQSKKENPIGHYLDKHEEVPLWVMINYLTIGNIQNFYMCIEESLQNEIAKEFSKEYKRSYSEDIHINPDILINVLKTTTLFRNVCAHEERLYSFTLNKPSKSAQVSKITNIKNELLDKGNLFTISVFLKLVLNKKEYKGFTNSLSKLFHKYSNKFDTVRMNDILGMMGFEENWESMVNGGCRLQKVKSGKFI